MFCLRMYDWCANFQVAFPNMFGRYFMFVTFIYHGGQLFFAFDITLLTWIITRAIITRFHVLYVKWKCIEEP